MKLLFLSVLLIGASVCYGRELYPGQYAQVDPQIRDWFGSQHVPGGGAKGGLCCSLADGTRAEEDREGNHYRTRFWYQANPGAPGGSEEKQSEWMDVPDETVIRGGTNPTGGAVVWYMMRADNEGGLSPVIRCFKPSADI